MAITILPARKNPIEYFTEGVSPYLQMAMEYMLKKKLGEPEEARAKAKETRETLASVAKGEVPIASIPKDIRDSVLNKSIDTTGLGGSPQALEAMKSIPSTAQVSLSPNFQSRLNIETPEAAQNRLMTSYVKQQQSINPYKALQANKLALWDRAVGGETLTNTEKILLGLEAKEDPMKMQLFNSIFGNQQINPPTPSSNPQPIQEVDEFGFKIGEIRKNHKYIGNNQWQAL
jgi:hypothetical protein